MEFYTGLRSTACQISEWSGNSKPMCRGFKVSQDLLIRRLATWSMEALGLWGDFLFVSTAIDFSEKKCMNRYTTDGLSDGKTDGQTEKQTIHTHKGDNVTACRRLDWVIQAYGDNTSQLWSLVLHIEENRSMKLHTTRPCFFPSDFLSNNGSGLPSDLHFQLRMTWWSGGWVGVFRALQLIDFQAFGVGD